MDGKVHAKAGGWRQRRMTCREEEPSYFWVVIVIYGGLSIAGGLSVALSTDF